MASPTSGAVNADGEFHLAGSAGMRATALSSVPGSENRGAIELDAGTDQDRIGGRPACREVETTDEPTRKPTLTPLEAVSIKAQRAGGEPWFSKQRVAGWSPAGRARFDSQSVAHEAAHRGPQENLQGETALSAKKYNGAV